MTDWMQRCHCPSHPGRTITNPARHDAWHALVTEQGGPAALVNAETLQAARGFRTGTPMTETVLDARARQSGKRSSGELRRAARAAS